MGSERGRPSADLKRLAGDHGTTTTTSPTSIGAILSTLFDGATEAYHAAIDAERWDVVWRVADLIDAIHAISEREVQC